MDDKYLIDRQCWWIDSRLENICQIGSKFPNHWGEHKKIIETTYLTWYNPAGFAVCPS